MSDKNTVQGGQSPDKCELNRHEQMALLVWAHLPGLTAKRKALLLDALDDPCDLLLSRTLNPFDLPLVRDDAQQLSQWRQDPEAAAGCFERELQWVRQPGHFITGPGKPLYPQKLRRLHDPPVPLFCAGRAELLQHPAIAIVGSRRPSVAARGIAYRLAAELGRLGFGVVSGLALGIDAAAHRGALDNDAPTLAVTATGLDTTYPRENGPLADIIVQQGLMMSEYPLETQPRSYHFPARNRILAGLADGVLVVEAKRKSGALYTARTAAELGMDVMVVPGTPAGGRNSGGHQLIRDGALLVEDTAQIVECLRPDLLDMANAEAKASGPNLTRLSELQQKLLKLLSQEPVYEDALCVQLGLPVSQLSSLLVEMELDGYVRREAGGYVRVF